MGQWIDWVLSVLKETVDFQTTSRDGIPDKKFPVKVGCWQFETSLQVLSLSTAVSY